jgi:hypothetical protein
MANNCELVESDDHSRLDEVQRQYEIASAFIDAAG